jgi:hypothetical protein
MPCFDVADESELQPSDSSDMIGCHQELSGTALSLFEFYM